MSTIVEDKREDLIGLGMNTSRVQSSSECWFDDENLWVELTDSRQLGVPLAYFPGS